MTNTQLADELRARQYDAGLVPREEIDALSDEAMIDSYITCSCCGRRQVTVKQLCKAIDLALDAEHFFSICEYLSTKVT